MQRPANNSLVAWLGAATSDLADSVADLNKILDEREKDPQWGDKAWHVTRDLLSLRRWSFILPGGGAARGGKTHKVRVRRAVEIEEIDEVPPATATPAAV